MGTHALNAVAALDGTGVAVLGDRKEWGSEDGSNGDAGEHLGRLVKRNWESVRDVELRLKAGELYRCSMLPPGRPRGVYILQARPTTAARALLFQPSPVFFTGRSGGGFGKQWASGTLRHHTRRRGAALQAGRRPQAGLSTACPAEAAASMLGVSRWQGVVCDGALVAW